MKNIWKRMSLEKNPYYTTAFAVARVPRETCRKRTVEKIIGQTRRIVNNEAQEILVGGKAVDEADLNWAFEILLNSETRMMEELIHHATERPPLEKIRKKLGEVDRMLEGEVDGEEQNPMPCVEGLGREALRAFVAEERAENTAFGAAELEETPPFGHFENGSGDGKN
jgi:hypothetical protein